MCCEADWKREVVEDHKWDYVDVRNFHETGFFMCLRYAFVYLFLLKNLAIYCLDIFTATTMLATDNWTNALYTKCRTSGSGKCDVDVKFGIAKWVFVGCIIFSFLLLAYEAYKAYGVYLSRDIAYAFTNLMAYDYFSIKNYDNFCLFCKIAKQKKKRDKLAFFIFFTFKDWKRVLLCDGPRQGINAVILWTILKAYNFQTDHIPAYWDGNPWTLMLLLAMVTTVVVFLVSFGLMIIAAVLYIPLVCYIQGNLKEYVCHKVDVRIGDIIQREQRKRIRDYADMEKRLARGEKIKTAKGEYVDQSCIVQPTLPQINLDDEEPTALRAASPAFGRVASPAFNRSASPAFNKSSAPAFAPPAASLRQPPDNDMEKAYDPYEDIFDTYSDGHSEKTTVSSTVSLLAGAAPPGVSPTYPPRAYPPRAPGAPGYSYPPPSGRSLYDARQPHRYAQPPNQQHGW